MTGIHKGRLLALLLLGWGVLIVLRLTGEEAAPHMPLKYTRTSSEASRPTLAASGLSQEKTGPAPPSPRRITHNLFASLPARQEAQSASRPVDRAPLSSAELDARRQKELVEAQASQPREPAIQQARQLMAQYRFLGYVHDGEQSRAFLSKGHDLYVVRTNETVDGRVRIKMIDADSIKLQETGTDAETTLFLVKDGNERF